MKESIYGWYPPARNIWKEYRKPPSSYDLECLYKHGSSRFADQAGFGTPLAPSHSPVTLSSRPSSQKIGQSRSSKTRSQSPSKLSKSSHGSRSQSASPMKSDHSHYESLTRAMATPAAIAQYQEAELGHVTDDLEEDVCPASFLEHTQRLLEEDAMRAPSIASRPMSVPSHSMRGGSAMQADSVASALPPRPPTSGSRRSTSSKKVWSTYVGGTPVQIYSSPQEMEKASRQASAQQPDIYPPSPAPPKPASSIRAHSASVSRQKTPSSPARSVRSACGVRSASGGETTSEKLGAGSAASRDRPKTAHSGSVSLKSDHAGGAATLAVQFPVSVPMWPPSSPWDPPVFTSTNVHEYLPVTEAMRDATVDHDAEPLDYEEQLQKYGWRMEIPGDPYNLKRPCLPKRDNFTTVIAKPTIAKELKFPHSQNKDTFFYNTIPARKWTFDIHPKFVSEVITAKRMELQKKEGGVNYRYKNYGFAY